MREARTKYGARFPGRLYPGLPVCLALLLLVAVGCGGRDEEQPPARAGNLVPQDEQAVDTTVAGVPAEAPAEAPGSEAAQAPAAGESDSRGATHPEPSSDLEQVDRSGGGGVHADIPRPKDKLREQAAASATRPVSRQGTAAASGRGPYCLQIGSFRDATNASRQVAELAAAGVEAEIVPATVAGTRYHRVWVTGLGSKAEATRLGERLQTELGLSYLVRKE